jgi:hypothetical protein
MDDHESYWEWVIGELSGHRVDITRPHDQPAAEVETRLFLPDEDEIEEALKCELVQRLGPVVSGSIWCGRWIYRKARHFDRVVVEEYPAPS